MGYKQAGSFKLDPAGGGVASVVPGANVEVDSTDPTAPVVSAEEPTGGVQSVQGGQSVFIDNTDPQNPIVKLGSQTNPTFFAEGSDIGIVLSNAARIVLDGEDVVTISGATIVLSGAPNLGLSIDSTIPRAQLSADDRSFFQLTGGAGPFLEALDGGFVIDSPFPMKPPHTATLSDYAASDYAGYVVYDDLDGTLKFSDGTDWVAAGGGGGGGVVSVTTDGEPLEVNNTDPTNPVVEFNRHNAFYVVHGNPPSPVGWLGQVMYFASDVSAGWTPGLHLSDNTQWLLISSAVDPG